VGWPLTVGLCSLGCDYHANTDLPFSLSRFDRHPLKELINREALLFPMRFKQNLAGYLGLGFAFFLFVRLPVAFHINVLTVITLLGVVLTGSLLLMVILAIGMLIGGFALMGWLTFRFVKAHRFG